VSGGLAEPRKKHVSHHPAAPPPADALDDFGEEVHEGLRASPKWLSPKWLYDQEGSRLFDLITELEEYYPTRVETQIMLDHVGEMAREIGPNAMLIEFGSGSSTKTRVLLDCLSDLAAYLPLDISEDHLLASAQTLEAEYPALHVVPVVADYTEPLDLPSEVDEGARRVVYFPGSTIGNFHPSEARRFLERVARLCGEHGGLLIGVDLKKDPRVLHAAYNDADGITAAFNLNLLTRLNRELSADFDPEAFVHYAYYNPGEGRIEMHIVSLREQVVTVAGERFHFDSGESLWTESSYKYAVGQFGELAQQAGFETKRVWTDEERRFGVLWLELP